MIPRKICMTWETKNFELQPMKDAVDSWKILNPSFEVKVFDKFDRENLVKEIDMVNKAYHIVERNSAKADILRLMYLYQNGGFYTDIDQICLKPISDYIEDDVEFVISTHSHNPRTVLLNGFIGTVPNSPLIKYLLDNICINVINLYNKKDLNQLKSVGHSITGPYILPKILNNWLKRNENTKFILGKQTLGGVNMLIIHHILKNGCGIQYEVNSVKVIQEKYEGYNDIRKSLINTATKKYCLLLTTFNIPERTTMYNETLNWWLENSEFDIFIVSSYVNNFKVYNPAHNKRVNIHLFQQPNNILLPDWHSYKPTSTEAEILSITEIYSKFNYKLLKYKYIVKLTGKYRLPDYVKLLDKMTKDYKEYDIARQGAHYRGKNICTNTISLKNVCHTETYIIKSSLFELFIKEISTCGFGMESRFAKFINKVNLIVFNLPAIKIPEKYRVKRGDGTILECL